MTNPTQIVDAQIEIVDHIDEEITKSITANNGARTKEDVLAVFNSTLLLLHELRSNLYEYKEIQTRIYGGK